MTNHTFTKAARELADKLEVELWDYCNPTVQTDFFRKVSCVFLLLFLLAGISAGISMLIFEYPKPTFLNYSDIFLMITASLLGIFGWQFFFPNLLSGVLCLILFFLLLFSGTGKILPAVFLPVFLLPALLMFGHSIFLHLHRASADTGDGSDSRSKKAAMLLEGLPQSTFLRTSHKNPLCKPPRKMNWNISFFFMPIIFHAGAFMP